jgi:hypothetical protein
LVAVLVVVECGAVQGSGGIRTVVVVGVVPAVAAADYRLHWALAVPACLLGENANWVWITPALQLHSDL